MAYLFAMKPGNRVRELRKAHGLSQIDLAQRAGISQAAISQVENDQRPLTVDWMRAFARIFGCAAADLLTDEDNPDRLGEAERVLVQNYRSADGQQQAIIERVAEPLSAHRAPADDRRVA